MKKLLTYTVMITYLTLGLNTAVKASQQSLERWQMNMIYQPSESVLEREARGFVHIYDGFDETQVERILDEKFERMDYMMVTRVRLTDSSGRILLDPDSGVALTEDDGCD